MLTLLLFCLPTILYVVQRTRAGDDRSDAIADAGAFPGTLRDYGWGLLLLVPITAVGWLGMLAVPVDVRLWPVLVAQVVTGLMLGWLRTRLGTCFPGIPANGLGAVAAAALAAVG